MSHASSLTIVRAANLKKITKRDLPPQKTIKAGAVKVPD